jgi:hypothetical protein
MEEARYQTVRLSRGRHISPARGVCVMELASMLAGEQFTDHPASVSRSIASFLRTYNDMVDDTRRQDLYTVAAKCVGTAAGEAAEVFRACRLLAWGEDLRRRRFCARPFGFLRRRAAGKLSKTPEEAGRYAANSIPKVSDEVHARVLALVDELIAMGSEPGAWNLSEAWPLSVPAARMSSSVAPRPGVTRRRSGVQPKP